MHENPIMILDQFATQLHKRVLPCNISDANAFNYSEPSRSEEARDDSTEPFIRMVSYKRDKRRVRILANHWWVHIGILGTFPQHSLSINKPDKISLLTVCAGGLALKGSNYPVFTMRGELSDNQKAFLRESKLLETIQSGELVTPESVNVNRGELMVYLFCPSLERLTTWVDGLFSLAIKIEKPSSREEIDLTALPSQFHSLLPLIEKWGVGDDSEREELLENSSKRVLTALVSEVEPYLSAVDSYLDSFRVEPPGEAACALGRLAEACIEARLLLKKK